MSAPATLHARPARRTRRTRRALFGFRPARLVAGALLWPLLALAIAALPLPAQAQAGKPLRLGVEGAHPPFSEIGTDGNLKGFDIDIANAVCARMKVRCTLVQAEFDAMIPALRARKFDAVVASVSITPERRKLVDFSDKYHFTPARFVARAGSPPEVTAAGLKGRKIGVQRSTSHDRFATATFRHSEIVRYAEQDDVFLDLASGRLDGALVDAVAGDLDFLKTPAGRAYAFVGPVFNDPAFFGEGAGIAVRKGDQTLRKRINEALAAIRADGTYQTIQEKYFDFDIYGPDPKK